ncbi:methyl-accepting chemotaxis protein [Clostridium sp. JNZ J1-5]
MVVFKRTIKEKLSLLLCISAVIPIVFISLFNYYIHKSTAESDFYKMMQYSSNHVSSIVSDTIKYNVEAVNMLSNSNYIKGVSSNPSLEAEMMNFMYNFRNTHKDIITTYFGNIMGHQYATVDKIPEGFDPRTRPWFKDAMKNPGKAIITSPYEDSNQKGRYVITVAETVKDANGQAVGVVGTDITLSYLADVVSNIKLGNAGYTAIIDSNNRIIAINNKDLLGKTSKEEPWINNAIKDLGKNSIVDIHGSKYISYTVENPATGWKMASFIPLSELKGMLSKTRNTIIFASFIFLAIAVLMGNLFGNQISKSIKNIVTIIEKISGGDFSHNIETNKKDIEELQVVAKSLNKMIIDINSLLKSIENSSIHLKESSENLVAITEESSSASEEVATAVQTIAKDTSEQCSSLQNSTDAILSLGKEVDTSLLNSKNMNEASDKVSKAAGNGIVSINDLKKNYNLNSEANSKLLDEVDDLDKSSKRIMDITNSIKSITEQTNLLALNASIEAARAGEAGRGFAVVAEEVRKLAEESASFASEIDEVLRVMQQNTNIVVEGIKNSKHLNDLTGDSVNITSSSFESILKDLKSLQDCVDKVTYSLEQINLHKNNVISDISSTLSISEQISATTEEVSASTEEQSAGFQQVVSLAENLSSLSNSLDENIKKFIM